MTKKTLMCSCFPVVENVFNEKRQKKTLLLSQIPRQCQIVIFSFLANTL